MDRSQAGIGNPGAGMSRLLHPLASRKRLLMAMASSLGGAPTNSCRGDCVVAGLLGTAEQWDRFETEWKGSVVEGEAALTSMGGINARGSDAPSGSSTRVGDTLAGLINACGLMGIGSHLSREEYERLSPDIQRTLTGGRPAEPSVLCFRHCMLEAAGQAAKLPPEEKVCFVLDGQDRLASQAPWLFEEIRCLEPAPVRARLGALGFEPKQAFAPLQAAEWLGREFLRHWGNGGANVDLCESVPADGSFPVRLLFKSFDRQAFRRLQTERRTEWNQSFSRL